MPISNVYNIDCMEGMKEFPDKFFELAVIDPPYGIKEDGKSNHGRGGPFGGKRNFGAKNTTNKIIPSRQYTNKEWDTDPANEIFFSELIRISRNQIVFGANHFIDRLLPANINSSCWIVWNKDNGGIDFADCELAWTSFKTAVRMFTFRWNGMLQGNMANKEVRIHPTQKPVPLYQWILKNYAKPSDKILDTHLGSGSSRIAAYKMGFDFWGYELDKEYFQAQEKRFKEAIAEPLFDQLKSERQNVFGDQDLFTGGFDL